ncbi:MAG TPA: hypothetical protein PKA80_02030 [Ignavibacteriaceae bacterium]|nr:hypothetical protein [Ignavibacteriaceae bacterium]
MGQQQLLLIVLGVIVVGIAVVVGINLFNANAESSAKDTIISEGTNLGALAQQYYKKPTSMDGGNNSFTGWTIPTALASTPTTAWEADVTADAVTLTGTPNDTDYDWTVTTVVTSTTINSTVD